MLVPLPPETAEQSEIDEYEMIGRTPAGFDKCDSTRIRNFSNRLKNLRIERNRAAKEESRQAGRNWIGNRRAVTAADLAEVLGVSPMCISKYENGKIKEIPMDRLRRICAHYGVTPHYILGYVDNEGDSLRLDEAGKIVLGEDGNAKVTHMPMLFESAAYQQVIEIYKDLSTKDHELFWLIYKLLSGSEEKREQIKKILKILVPAELN